MLNLNKIYQGDCLELLKEIPDKGIDLVLTDPPYGINKDGVENDSDLEVYYNSLPELYRVLKEGGFFVTFASIGNLPDFFRNNPFNYRWQYIVYINNGMVRGSIGFNRYISVLIFQKGDAKLTKPLLDVIEVSTSAQQCAKRKHPTEKREDVCRKLILALSKPKDIVLDPFAGAGSILVSAKQTDRQFIGIELVKDYVDSAERKLCQKTMSEVSLLSSHD